MARRARAVVGEVSDSHPSLDFLLVADRAEAVNGKLYMMGGGWDRLGVVDFNQPVNFSLALGVVVPWNAANDEHHVHIELRTEDGMVIDPQMDVSVVVGRPAFAARGQSFRAVLAANATFRLPAPGAYELVAHLAVTARKRTVFYAEQVQAFGPATPAGPARA